MPCPNHLSKPGRDCPACLAEQRLAASRGAKPSGASSAPSSGASTARTDYRAGLLVFAALREAASTKMDVAFDTWLAGNPKTRIFAGVVGGAASGAAAAAAVAGTVATVGLAAATFGIGPLVAVVVTMSLLKLGKMYAYRSNSKAVTGALRGEGGPAPVTLELLAPTMAKVIRKYERVVERHHQVSDKHWKVTRGAAMAWNPRTAGKTWTTKIGKEKFSKTVTPNDESLHALLRLLRFYGQALYNGIDEIIETFLEQKRNHLAHKVTAVNKLVCAYAASHKTPTGCREELCMATTMEDRKRWTDCGILDEEIAKLEWTEDDLIELARSEWQPLMLTTIQEHRTRMAEIQGIGKKGTTKTVNDRIEELQKVAIVASPDVTAAVKPMVMAVAKPVMTGAYVGGAGLTSAATAVVAGEVVTTVKNRLTRKSVRAQTDAAKALVILDTQQVGASLEAIKELKDLLGKHDIISRGPRVVQKIVWYVKKLEKIEERFLKLHGEVIGIDGRANFKSCNQAYELLRETNYFYRNCEKLIAFLVYAEAVLIQIDRAVADLGIGVNPGDIIRPGMKPVPPQASEAEALVVLEASVEEQEWDVQQATFEASRKKTPTTDESIKDAGDEVHRQREAIGRRIHRQLLPIEADGNCFFRAVCVASGRPTTDHGRFRVEAMNRIVRDPDLRAIARAISPDYTETMRPIARSAADTDRYGGYLEAVALARYLTNPIHIFVEGRALPIVAGEDHGGAPIEIYWHAYGHYSALRPEIVRVEVVERLPEVAPIVGAPQTKSTSPIMASLLDESDPFES